MGFTLKWLQRQDADALKALLSDDDAELSDDERERITNVLAEKEKPSDDKGESDEDDAFIDRIADRIVGKLTAAEKIADAASADADADADKDKDKSGDDDDKDKDKDKSKSNGDKKVAKPSLAARFHGN